jgi:DNA-binding MarR family transcriptional regulator
MKPPDTSRAHRITARDQAVAMDHPLRSKMLLACAHRDRTLTELASELDQPLPKLHYHLAKLTRSGLLRVSRVEPRAGRPVRRYRAIAEAFLLSLADVAEPVGEKLASDLRRSLAEDASRRDRFLLYHLDEAGRFRVRLMDPDGQGRTPRAFEYWKILKLTPEQRKALATELAEVISRYETAPDAAGSQPSFLVHAAFALKP